MDSSLKQLQEVPEEKETRKAEETSGHTKVVKDRM